MAAIEATIRTRLYEFLDANNSSASWGFTASHIFKYVPPNWPVDKGITVEVESEDRGGRTHYTQYYSSSYRKLTVKLGVFWGNVLPATRGENIEAKLNLICEAIEQSTYLLTGVDSASNYAAGDGEEVFDYIDITAINKIYDGAYAIGGTITMEWQYPTTWQKDTTITL